MNNGVNKHAASHWSRGSEPVPGSWAVLGKIEQLRGFEDFTNLQSLVSTRPSTHVCLFRHLCLFSQLLSPRPSRIPSSAPSMQPFQQVLTKEQKYHPFLLFSQQSHLYPRPTFPSSFCLSGLGIPPLVPASLFWILCHYSPTSMSLSS